MKLLFYFLYRLAFRNQIGTGDVPLPSFKGKKKLKANAEGLKSMVPSDLQVLMCLGGSGILCRVVVSPHAHHEDLAYHVFFS